MCLFHMMIVRVHDICREAYMSQCVHLVPTEEKEYLSLSVYEAEIHFLVCMSISLSAI